MKILKFIYSVSLVLSCNVVSFANQTLDADTIKTHLPSVGQKSLLISINPLISFVGNMFNGTTDNGLYLTSGSILYRKYLEKNVTKRYRLNFQISSINYLGYNEKYFPDLLKNGTHRTNYFSLTYAFGKEKRYQMKNISLYTGWEVFSRASHYSEIWKYEYNKGDEVDSVFPDYSLNRIVSEGNYNQLQGGIVGLLGIDYHFSKMFYVSMELSIPLVINFELISERKYEDVKVIGNRIVDVMQQDTEKPTLLWDVYINSSQLLQFRAGVVF